MEEERYERLLHNNRKLSCRECGGKLKYVHSGEYACLSCGATELDDFGLIRKYLQENGPSSREEIILATGIPGDRVNAYMKQERLVAVSKDTGSSVCSRCGKKIDAGTLCNDCRREMKKGSAVSSPTGTKAKTRYMGREK
ncbi:MAG: hypothetical protein K5697_07705 [Lachnospiraceae bacterium]|nr:hypothetical protein [Lachnospiraceae bacterium]